MDMLEALLELEVLKDTVTEKEKAALDRDGYVPFFDILSTRQLSDFKARLDELVTAEGGDAGKEVHQEAGTERLSDLINKDAMFDVCFTHPRVLAAIAYVLKGDMKLSSLNYRAALPGYGLQQLHVDWNGAVAPGDFYVCNSIWLLDDFTQENGATRVVPGSHLWEKAPKDAMDDPAATHSEEKLLIAPAGTVVVFNSHTWHGGKLNRTKQRRRALHSYFCRRDQPQQLDQRKYIGPETYARLGAGARYILDVESSISADSSE
jgi:ectoine hydroxylase-related dioxygenase (phytanoyl-CoA dioxygenase family)